MLNLVPSVPQEVCSSPSRRSLDCIVRRRRRRRRGTVNPMPSKPFAPMYPFVLQHVLQEHPRIRSSHPLTHTAFVPTHIVHTSIHHDHLLGQYPKPPLQPPINNYTAPPNPSNQIHHANPTTLPFPISTQQLNPTQLHRRQKNKKRKTTSNDVHPPHLPLAALPPPALHRHRDLLARRSAPRSRPFRLLEGEECFPRGSGGGRV